LTFPAVSGYNLGHSAVKNETKRLLEVLDRFPGKRIVVWGDFILDEYLYGTTRRISREAPVLILSYASREFTLGGAGNALLNLKAAGAVPVPVGVLGRDAAGRKILGMMRKQGIESRYMVLDKSYSTPIKTRILAGEQGTRKQQILRIDKESRVPDTRELIGRLRKNLEQALRGADALLVSDYDYLNVKEDVYRKILPRTKKACIPVALDSRFRLLAFQGMTVVTPNEPEVENALHISLDDDPEAVYRAGRRILQTTGADAVLVTRGSKGMVLFKKHRRPYPIPIHGTPHIVDVTGAGDTVISVLLLALCSGATFRQAARLANFAGGIVVMKKGTATVSSPELKEAIVSGN